MSADTKKRIQEVADLWNQHSAASFPDALRMMEIDGGDAISLDATVAGCVQTFLAKQGRLDLWRTATLGLCYGDLARWTAGTPGNEIKYVRRLEEMARLVLEFVLERSKPN
jgi:hypothetical protein